MPKIKEDKTSEKELNETHLSDLLDNKFKGIVLKMVTRFQRMDELREDFIDVEYIKNEPIKDEYNK